MRWLAEAGGPGALAGGVCQWSLLTVPPDLDRERLVTALQAVIDHHDMLRARLADAALHVEPPGAVRAGELLSRVDATGLEIRRVVAEQVAAAELDVRRGKVMWAVWLDHGPSAPGRLLLIVHHLVADGVSWRILPPDLGGVRGAGSG